MLSKKSKLLLYVICAITLLIFLVMTVLFMVMIVTNDDLLLRHLFHPPNFQRPPMRIVESIFMVFSTLKCLFSIFAIHGIRKDIPGLLLPFLGYGSFLAIMMLTITLLLVISGHRMISLILFLNTVLYISGLTKVYQGYNIMWRLNEDLQNLLEDPLLEDDVLIEA